ncbi:MAG: hypothetical protein ILP10_07010 [Lachnospiraceae bacterium]|nr:hypothetical protein [Lachnospiraceae bacterium]
MKAFVSLGAGVVAVLAYIVLALISQMSGGNAGFSVGVTGFCMAILSIVGFILGLISLRERDIFYAFPIAGIVTSGLGMLIYLVSYILGLAQLA